MKNTLTIIGVLVAAVVAFLWYREHDAAVKFQALAEQRQAELQAAAESLAVRDRAIALSDSAAAVEKEKLLKQNRQLRVRSAATQLIVDSATAELKETLDSTQRQQLDSITTSYRSIIADRDTQIKNLTAIVANDSTRIADRDSVLAGYRRLNQHLLAQVDKLTKYSKPSKLDLGVKYATLALVGIAAFK